MFWASLTLLILSSTLIALIGALAKCDIMILEALIIVAWFPYHYATDTYFHFNCDPCKQHEKTGLMGTLVVI